MRAGPGWVIWLALLAGCAGFRADTRQALLADRNPSAHTRDLELHYQVRYPDILAVEVRGRPDLSTKGQVSLDGRVALAGVPVAADGRSTPQVARELAARLGLPASAV